MGCGCSARLGAELLIERGWSVRGTSRQVGRLESIEAVGAEAARADPDLVGDVVELVGDVTVLAWCLGRADGGPETPAARVLAEERLASLIPKLVDTPVRGVVVERDPGSAPGRAAAAVTEDAAARWHLPARLIDADREPTADWAERLADAVEAVVGESA